ncbi:MAG TPA: bifunctional UDP-3-O-[3-hydroxymyristoyl] N-acetylglucosamine deacetylase/3-hydroxyacyl-ACP dehydratase [Bacteroidales bacterium]|nr:bifunctional UDP-3-O-[3-hydroxymyristoyl] N-acetylglucosamine deacetylase/3-hydroxyacyl-ACP dehydratase [Bacteroidales bacterium]
MKQRTLKTPITISGSGLHTGQLVNLTFKPAAENTGYVFKRIDLEGQPEIEAIADNVTDTNRGTSLEKNNARVQTVEHVLAALAGLQIDNCLIEMDNQEPPITDGSSKYFVQTLQNAGIEEQNAEREYLVIDEVLTYNDPKHKSQFIAIPADHFKLTTLIDFETKVLGTQNAVLERIEDFATEISPCRTFVFLHELEFLLNNNLVKGGDLSNAIVFVNKAVTQEELDRLARLFNKPSVAVKSEGILNNIDLHFPNEPARHKLLDVIGDLTLAGKPIKGHIIATKPGHSSNAEFAKILRKHWQKSQSIQPIPQYDPDKEPLFDIKDIMRKLPHRPPFLLIDKILEMSKTHVVGLKNVTMNESFFVGHFPDEPVMPGVLQIEAMAQTGGILVLSTVPDPENYLTFFLKIEEVKFRHKVVPGDTLIFNLSLIAPIRRGLCQMKGIAYVGKTIVMEANMLAQITKKS